MLIVCGFFSVQSINDDLNASLATADELSKEFNSLLKEASSNTNTSGSQVHTHTHTHTHACMHTPSALFPTAHFNC